MWGILTAYRDVHRPRGQLVLQYRLNSDRMRPHMTDIVIYQNPECGTSRNADAAHAQTYTNDICGRPIGCKH